MGRKGLQMGLSIGRNGLKGLFMFMIRKGLMGLSIARNGLKGLFMGRVEGTVYGKDGRDCLWEGWKGLFMGRMEGTFYAGRFSRESI